MTDVISLADKVISKAKSLGIDYADVRIRDNDATNFLIQNEDIEGLMTGKAFGIGVRVIVKGYQGFYSTNNINEKNILNKAISLAKSSCGEKIKLSPAEIIKDKFISRPKKPPQNISIEDKVKFIRNLIKSAHLNDKIKTVSGSYSEAYGDRIFMNTEGTEITSSGGRVLSGFSINSKEGSILETTRSRRGGFGFEAFDDLEEDIIKKAHLAVDLLKAKKPKAGIFKVILNREATGVFAHEAVGHTCEADAVTSNASVLCGKLGKKIGSDAVYVSDTPTFDGEFGCYKYDDEGVPAQYTKLIVNGILKSYLHSRTTAAYFNTKSTGNARSESYAFLPQVRMSTTLIEPGNYSRDELAELIKEGYLLCGSLGGHVSILEGNFNFSSEYGYKIHNGKIGELIKSCNFGGETLETLKHIIAVGRPEKFGFGICGKGGQSVPVSDGRSDMAVEKLKIGGNSDG